MMKKMIVGLVGAAVVLSSCGSATATGAYVGGEFGHVIVMWLENAILFIVLLFGLVNKIGTLFKYLFSRISATIAHFRVSIPDQIH